MQFDLDSVRPDRVSYKAVARWCQHVLGVPAFADEPDIDPAEAAVAAATAAHTTLEAVRLCVLSRGVRIAVLVGEGTVRSPHCIVKIANRVVTTVLPAAEVYAERRQRTLYDFSGFSLRFAHGQRPRHRPALDDGADN